MEEKTLKSEIFHNFKYEIINNIGIDEFNKHKIFRNLILCDGVKCDFSLNCTYGFNSYYLIRDVADIKTFNQLKKIQSAVNKNLFNNNEINKNITLITNKTTNNFNRLLKNRENSFSIIFYEVESSLDVKFYYVPNGMFNSFNTLDSVKILIQNQMNLAKKRMEDERKKLLKSFILEDSVGGKNEKDTMH